MSIKLSGKVYGDLTGSIFEPQVKSIANVITGTLSINNGGTGLNFIGDSGSILTSNGTGLVYTTISEDNFTSDLNGAINALTASISSSFVKKNGDSFIGGVSSSLGISSSFYLLQDNIRLSSSLQLGTLSASNSPANGDILINKQTDIFSAYADWTEEKILTGSYPKNDSDYFGYSIDINSVGNKIVVGAYNDETYDGSGEWGVVYLFASSSNNWTEEQRFVGIIPFFYYDAFGYSVTINAAGTVLVVGGIYDEATGSSSTGAAYVFASSSAGWSRQQILTGTLAVGANDNFGNSIAINSTGNKFIVGAPGREKPGGADGAGLAYIFASSSAGWYQQEILSGSLSINAYDRFGYSVALNSSGDKAVIGVNDSNNPYNHLYAYIFASSSAGWKEEAVLSGSRAIDQLDRFGEAVAINSAGDRVIIGAPGDEASGAGDASGLAYIFTSSSIGWLQEAYMSGSSAIDFSDLFGISVDINSTGDKIIIGASNDDSSIYSSNGLAYVFASSSTGWKEQKALSGSLSTTSDFFGRSVAMNSMGNILAVGAIGDEAPSAANASGLVYVFSSGSTTTTNENLATKTLSGSYTINQILELQSLSILPTGALGMIAVSGSNFYFHDGILWRTVSLS